MMFSIALHLLIQLCQHFLQLDVYKRQGAVVGTHVGPDGAVVVYLDQE